MIVINEILDEIKKAEEGAEKIVTVARQEVSKIERQNQSDIEALREASEVSVAAQIKQATEEFEKNNVTEEIGRILNVPKAKQERAHKHIVAEFHKTYISGVKK